MHLPATRPRPAFLRTCFAVLALLVAGSITYPAAEALGRQDGLLKPTIVLVHGAWADASGWNGVAERLQSDGYTVVAPANPLRGLPTDAAYLSSVLDTVPGPVVVAGHSYGGMVMTNAAAGRPNVKALVYIAAFAPDLGDTVGGLGAMNPGSELGPATLLFRPHPTGLDVYIAPDSFRSVFAADISARATALMAAGQRPIDAAALGQPSGVPAWQTIPSWYLVATQDHAIPPATQRFMAQRAAAITVEASTSHAAMVAKPRPVTELILDAVHATA
jgi:pimeloyl-ACP methyl ester carboxylesterase